jgi:DMSO/TMAO reductase YedYZ molybdopterin-dependent catalytic subunit
MTIEKPDRRRLLSGAVASAGALLLGGCDQTPGTVDQASVLNLGEEINRRVQRLLLSPGSLAPEYTEADLSPVFKANGTDNPTDKEYQSLAQAGFNQWRLIVDGLVERPLHLSLADLRSMPSRTQITRHDCVEGWSCIGKWTGVPLAAILQNAVLKPRARFAVFHCADSMSDSGLEENPNQSEAPKQSDANKAAPASNLNDADANNKDADADQQADDNADKSSESKYYESLDLIDAFHPQTIIAYDMNNAPLTVPHGAPVRLRVERQLGYKSAKYVMRIEIVESFAQIGNGHGGYWEDQGYDWYAGI